jgi:hypothetical protein
MYSGFAPGNSGNPVKMIAVTFLQPGFLYFLTVYVPLSSEGGLKPLILREKRSMTRLERCSRGKVTGSDGLLPFRPSVTCNFPGWIASNLRLNLYFREANEAGWQSRRFAVVAAAVCRSDHGVRSARNGNERGRA